MRALAICAVLVFAVGILVGAQAVRAWRTADLPTSEVPIASPRPVPRMLNAVGSEGFEQELLEAAGIPLTLSELIQRVTNPREDPAIRYAATLALGELGDRSATPVLLALLKERGGELRTAAILALGSLGDPAALSGLKKALKDPTAGVRSAAVDALARIGGPKAVAALGKALLKRTEDRDLRVTIALRLGQAGQPLAERSLRRTLADPALEVRTAAAIGLATLGARDAIPFLVAALENPAASEWLVDRSLMALSQVTGADFGYPKPFFAPSSPEERAAAIQRAVQQFGVQRPVGSA